MTGPEHYKAAEDILAEAKDADPRADQADVALFLEFAKVHAMLAQAAAMGLAAASTGELPPGDCDSWRDVAAINSVQGGGDR